MPHRTLDFLVTAIDNFGDTGFALDLAESLLTLRPDWKVRFFSDNRALFDRLTAGRAHPGVEYFELSEYETFDPSPEIVSFFDRKLPEEHFARFSIPKKILQLSYLRFDADKPGRPGVGSLNGTRYRLGTDEVVHLVPSPLAEGAGIISNPKAEERKRAYELLGRIPARERFFFDTGREERIPEAEILDSHAVSAFFYPESKEKIRMIGGWLPKSLMVGFRASVDRNERRNGFVRPKERENSGITWFFRFLRFDEYETVLPLFDANIVRGENSAAKAILSWKPFLWDFYKEKNGAHEEKIADFLAYMEPFFEESDFMAYVRALSAFNSPIFSEADARACAEILAAPSDSTLRAFEKAAEAGKGNDFVKSALSELEEK